MTAPYCQTTDRFRTVMPAVSEDSTSALVRALSQRACFDHPVDRIRIVETHISYVLLTGAFAYKIKKPVTLPFLDFSTLEKRRAACYEELRVNSRLAPKLYLGVVRIGGSIDTPIMDAPGEAIEYAVKMRQFPDSARLDRVMKRDDVSEAMMRDLGRQVARFHAGIETGPPAGESQDSEQRFSEIAENFETLRKLPPSADRNRLITELRDWSMESLVLNGELLRKRRRDGFVRECHGDMHLENLALFDGEIVIFDGVEFSESLRWTDVMSEVAFLVMDLLNNDRPDLAYIFLSTYLEITGDYEGLAILRHYVVYRAMVRAKVTAIRINQLDLGKEQRSKELARVDGFLRLAHGCISEDPKPFLVITCGPSGAGKSYLSERLCGILGAIRIRSDVERQRRARPGEFRYSAFARHRTYMRVETNADKVLQSGYPVIVDATFIRAEYRQRFRQLANDRLVPFAILWLKAPTEILENRVKVRSAEGTDASEAGVDVLEQQLDEMEPPSPAESEFTLEVDTSSGFNAVEIERFIRRLWRLPLEHHFNRYSSAEDHAPAGTNGLDRDQSGHG